MIRDQWYVILESKQVRRALVAVQRMGERLVLWRDERGTVRCLVDRCCHRGVALSAGTLKAGAVQCPFHGLEYDGTGRCTTIPANARSTPVPANFRVPAYPVHEAHGWIWIWWGNIVGGTHNPAVSEPVGQPDYFPDIDSAMVWSTVQDHWKAHYSRVLENQLDVVHVPFVHHNTIGRGNRTVVDGPGVRWINNRMLYTYPFNRVDDGTPPRTPAQVPVPPTDRVFKLEMIVPNLWENFISEKLRIVAAFVPVAEDRTILYLRTYRTFGRLPVVRSLMNLVFARTNLTVAHQDRRVVETQRPLPSALRGGEQLIQGDLPIIEYRKKRQQLLDAAAGTTVVDGRSE